MTYLAALTFLLQVRNFWVMRNGHVPYYGLIAVYSGYAVLEGWLAIRDPAQATMGLFVLLDLWAVAMMLKGVKNVRSNPS